MRVCSCVLAITFAVSTSAADVAQNPVSSRKLSNTLYELRVTVKAKTDVVAAQGLLIPEEKKVCGEQPFQFGHYSFASKEKISDVTGSTEPPRLTLRQEVTCGLRAATSN